MKRRLPRDLLREDGSSVVREKASASIAVKQAAQHIPAKVSSDTTGPAIWAFGRVEQQDLNSSSSMRHFNYPLLEFSSRKGLRKVPTKLVAKNSEAESNFMRNGPGIATHNILETWILWIFSRLTSELSRNSRVSVFDLDLTC